ncbi:glucose-1-phosphate adenylyltransferase [Saccharibacillus alkalitolerans]|uniref:Glucose-1-phosphate adenylyltransferase n=1 Tax=Saccharibacillus alkalitolerans TaxID=2705290 RepID=A0ABX0F1T8_9BACL|nr:glucose-1-phosphate adenylyltransferase [Saccharibacillus alkalitolerans]NGZ74522.1 glucose-1-phosphate adenylyltransferase [Saccharibacillus alkalitolerans]
MIKKDCIAMLLAGGEGRRLAPLTSTLAKPAVPFGGHYRIVDFPLSNCLNSGIDTVGVLTQYAAESLHDHIGEGAPWKNASADGDIVLLPPGEQGEYRGTADAITKNIEFIDQYDPENVLILSGDHIYHMDYADMLEAHNRSGANATLSVMEVPLNEAHRFGIVTTDANLRVVDFTEKPAKPMSSLASMGIYVFKWSYLRSYLLNDLDNEASGHDFGKDLLPLMLNDGSQLNAYPFAGYWRDVGTANSLWEAHMDLLGDNSEFQLNKSEWPMYTNRQVSRPSLFRRTLAPSPISSMVHETCTIEGTVKHSVLFRGVQVGKGSMIADSVIMPEAHIGRNVKIEYAIIGENAVIRDGAEIKGTPGEILIIGPSETVYAKPVIRSQSVRSMQEPFEPASMRRTGGLSS